MLHAEEGNFSLVKNYIENPNNEIDLEQKNESGFTVLALAVKSQNLEIITYLIMKGANINS